MYQSVQLVRGRSNLVVVGWWTRKDQNRRDRKHFMSISRALMIASKDNKMVLFPMKLSSCILIINIRTNFDDIVPWWRDARELNLRVSLRQERTEMRGYAKPQW